MKIVVPIFVLVLPLAFSRPTIHIPELPDFPDLQLERDGSQPDTFSEVIDHVSKDLTRVAESKAALVNLIAKTAVNAAADVGVSMGASAVGVGNTVVRTVSADNIEAAINSTEDAIKDSKVAMIESVFDAKRQLIRGLQGIPTQINGLLETTINSNMSITIVNFLNETIANLNNAIETTQASIGVSKAIVADMVAQVTIENAHNAAQTTIDNAQNGIDNILTAVNDVIVSTGNAVQSTGQAMLETLVSTKEELAEALSAFDSQATIHEGKVNLAMTLNASLQGAENYAEQAGVFDAIDGVVHGIANVPSKINTLLAIETEDVEDSKKEMAHLDKAEPEAEAEVEIRDEKEDANETEGKPEAVLRNEEQARPKRDYVFDDDYLEESEDMEIELPAREYTEDQLEHMLEEDEGVLEENLINILIL